MIILLLILKFKILLYVFVIVYRCYLFILFHFLLYFYCHIHLKIVCDSVHIYIPFRSLILWWLLYILRPFKYFLLNRSIFIHFRFPLDIEGFRIIIRKILLWTKKGDFISRILMTNTIWALGWLPSKLTTVIVCVIYREL